jgi:hypothetical protein
MMRIGRCRPLVGSDAMGQHQSAIKIKANFREEGVKVFIFRESWTGQEKMEIAPTCLLTVTYFGILEITCLTCSIVGKFSSRRAVVTRVSLSDMLK